MLDRPLSAEYREEWSAHFAREKQSSPPGRISTVLFRTESEWFALPTHAFQEVAEQRQIHSLPHRRQGVVVGLANIRGELVICASLNRLLGLEKSVPDDGQQTAFKRLLVVSWEGQRLAFVVDEVHGIQRFQAQELKPAPATVAKSNPTFTQGVFSWQRHTVGFLDADSLFSTLNRSLT